jgi:hypothetical protein
MYERTRVRIVVGASATYADPVVDSKNQDTVQEPELVVEGEVKVGTSARDILHANDMSSINTLYVFNTGSVQVILNFQGVGAKAATTGPAHIYLDPGEDFLFQGGDIDAATDITVTAGSGTGEVYAYISGS